MASPFPPRLPDLLNPGPDYLVKNPIDSPEWLALLEHVQAIMATLGTNPQSDQGTIANRFASMLSVLTLLGTAGYVNLRMANHATAPDTKLVVTVDVIGVEGLAVSAVSVTLDIQNPGKNGITGTRAANTWWYLWLGIKDVTLEPCLIADASATRGGLTLTDGSLAGFSHWRRVGAWRLDATGSGNLLRGAFENGRMLYETDNNLFVNGATNPVTSTAATKSAAAFVPTTSRRALLFCNVQTQNLPSGQLLLAPTGATFFSAVRWHSRAASSFVDSMNVIFMRLDAAQSFDAKVSAAAFDNSTFIGVHGYDDPI